MAQKIQADAVVIGSGPAGLMAAEALAEAGREVIVFEAKPSAGRKFLMAGKSGLNLTADVPADDLIAACSVAGTPLEPALRAFDSAAVQNWARGLGQEVFTGSSARVFPKAMKASPLLRAWLARLEGLGVTLRTRHRFAGWTGKDLCFSAPDGEVLVEAQVTVLALGGASWSRLGSDGAWAPVLQEDGVPLAPFRPANGGLAVAWSGHMEKWVGQPVKSIALQAGEVRSRGEFVISKQGIEGGGIYDVFAAVRDGAPLTVDLLPDLTLSDVQTRLARPRGKVSLSNHLRRALRLAPIKMALLQEFARPLPHGVDDLAQRLKALPVVHNGPLAMDDAISTAGGVSYAALTPDLMLSARPGVFVAGEMIDWEAPTGGYLISACLASGLWAGRAAAAWR